MLKKLVLVFASLFAACEGGSVSSYENGVQGGVNAQTRIEDPTPTTTRMVENRRDVTVEERSNDYGLPLLRREANDHQLEIRLWSTIGLTYFERCLRLRQNGSKWSATLIVPSIREGELVRLKNNRAEVTKTDIPISAELSQKLSDLVEEQHLGPPLPFSPDQTPPPAILDEGIITLEARRGSMYDVVSYRAFTSAPDGKRLVEICKSLELTLGNYLGCEHK